MTDEVCFLCSDKGYLIMTDGEWHVCPVCQDDVTSNDLVTIPKERPQGRGRDVPLKSKVPPPAPPPDTTSVKYDDVLDWMLWLIVSVPVVVLALFVIHLMLGG